MQIALTAMVVSILLSIVSMFARREQARYACTGNSYKMERTLIYVCLSIAVVMIGVALFLCMQAAYFDGTHGGGAEVPACVGLVSACCAFVWSVYQVVLDKMCVRFGLMARRTLDYTEIKEIRDIRNQGSPRILLVSKSGEKFNLWSNLLGYENLIAELKIKCPSATYRVVERPAMR